MGIGQSVLYVETTDHIITAESVFINADGYIEIVATEGFHLVFSHDDIESIGLTWIPSFS